LKADIERGRRNPQILTLPVLLCPLFHAVLEEELKSGERQADAVGSRAARAAAEDRVFFIGIRVRVQRPLRGFDIADGCRELKPGESEKLAIEDFAVSLRQIGMARR